MRSRRPFRIDLASLLTFTLALAPGCGRSEPATEPQSGVAAPPVDPGAGTRGAGDTLPTPALPLGTGKRVSLLVGVDRYVGTGLRDLEFAEKDATDLSATLTGLGYSTTLMTRAEFKRLDKDFLLPTAANIRDQLAAITKTLKPEDVILVAFSGHGVHLKRTDKLYYCPTGANLDREESLIAVDEVLAAFKGCPASCKIVVMDACRNDPGDGRTTGTPAEVKSATRPLIPDLPGGTLALFSCSKGEIAYESKDHKRGFLFHYLIEGLGGKAANKSGNVTWLGLADYLAGEVPDAVRREKGPKATQTPEIKGEIRGHVVLAKYEVKSVPVPKVDVTKVGLKPGEERSIEIADGVKMTFCWVPAGECQLGSPQAEQDYITKTFYEGKRPSYLDTETEAVRGTFKTGGFWMGKYAVTQAEWAAVMGTNPSEFDGKKANEAKGLNTSRFPVENVSWDMICGQDGKGGFLAKVNAYGGIQKAFGKAGTFVLPHEDMWEYACRGGLGNGRPFYFGPALNGTQANIDGNDPFGTATKGPYLKRPTAVGEYAATAPHPWGLCDMHGNVYQWCENPYDKTNSRVIRGGSWFGNGRDGRAAYRFRYVPDLLDFVVGVRLCLPWTN